jgi:transcriptional regulator with XRE-family HTH domain
VLGDIKIPNKLTDFIKQVPELRRKFGIPQEKLAKQLGIARSSLACIEAGHRTPSAEVLWKLMVVLNESNLNGRRKCRSS